MNFSIIYSTIILEEHDQVWSCRSLTFSISLWRKFIIEVRKWCLFWLYLKLRMI